MSALLSIVPEFDFETITAVTTLQGYMSSIVTADGYLSVTIYWAESEMEAERMHFERVLTFRIAGNYLNDSMEFWSAK